jgi:C4-dicarboxylate-specific signal transduction histidine kinase
MQNFSRSHGTPKQTFNSKAAILRISDMLAEQLRLDSIDLKLNLEDIFIYGDEQAFEQVMVNLIVNASDALRSNSIEEPKISVESDVLADAVTVKVTDNAGGIDEDVMPHVFDPFFTTKDPDKGTGLGLAICHNLIEDMDGKLEVQNTNNGAVFCVRLPSAEDA